MKLSKNTEKEEETPNSPNHPDPKPGHDDPDIPRKVPFREPKEVPPTQPTEVPIREPRKPQKI